MVLLTFGLTVNTHTLNSVSGTNIQLLHNLRSSCPLPGASAWVWLLCTLLHRGQGPHTTSQRSLSGPCCLWLPSAHLNEIYQGTVCIQHILLLFCYLLGLPHGLWELSSTTGAWSQALCSGSIDSEPLDSQGISYNTLILLIYLAVSRLGTCVIFPCVYMDSLAVAWRLQSLQGSVIVAHGPSSCGT